MSYARTRRRFFSSTLSSSARSFARPFLLRRVVRVPVDDLGLDDRRQVLAAAAFDRPGVVGEEVVAHAGRAEVRLLDQDAFGEQVGAAVLVAANAIRRLVAGAELDVRVRAPARTALTTAR